MGEKRKLEVLCRGKATQKKEQGLCLKSADSVVAHKQLPLTYNFSRDLLRTIAPLEPISS